MKRLLWVAGASTLTLSWALVAPEAGKTQTIPRECPAGSIECASQQQQYNQRLNYRTNPQIFQRRVNNANSVCSQSNSSACDKVIPEFESYQNNNTIRQLQELQQTTIENNVSK
jgi:hypothetical protein